MSYDPEWGVITWKKRPTNNVPAGSVAGKLLPTGYRHIRFKRKQWYAHRLAWYIHTGVDPIGWTVDHINGNKDDNRIENLRLAYEYQQRGNTGLRSDNTSGVRGVSWSKRDSKWEAKIQRQNRTYMLGRFDTKEEAAAAYQEAATAYFGEFATDPHYASKLMRIINQQAQGLS